MSWPPITDGPYWSPSPGANVNDPARSTNQPPPQNFTEDTGEFTVTQTFKVTIQAGATARFYATFAHDKDGAISPAGLAVAFKDSDGQTVLTAGVTATAPALDSGSTNRYFTSAQIASNLPPGNYRVVWSGTYTPVGTSTALNILSSRPFVVTSMTPPSKFFLFTTAKA